MVSRLKNRPASVYALCALLLLLSVNALIGGYLLITDPTGGSLGMPVTLLAASPFRDYFVPGLILFTILGLYPLAALVALWLKPAWSLMRELERLTHAHWAWAAALSVGCALTIWIVVQMSILSFWLQPVLLTLGLLIIGLSLLPQVRRYYALKPDTGYERRGAR